MVKKIAGPIEPGDTVIVDEKLAGYKRPGKFEVTGFRTEKSGEESVDCLNDRGQFTAFRPEWLIIVHKGPGSRAAKEKSDKPTRIKRKKTGSR